MAFSVTILPNSINFVRRKVMTNAEKAEWLMTKKTRYKSKEIRKSEVFKKRLASILKTIEETAEKDKGSRITVTCMSFCSTDQELRKALQERDFSVHTNYDDKNSMTISWD